MCPLFYGHTVYKAEFKNGERFYLSFLDVHNKVGLHFNTEMRQKTIAGFIDKVTLLFNKQKWKGKFYLFEGQAQRENDKGFWILIYLMDTWYSKTCPQIQGKTIIYCLPLNSTELFLFFYFWFFLRYDKLKNLWSLLTALSCNSMKHVSRDLLKMPSA